MKFTAGRTKPCAGCPWRKDNASRSQGVPGAHSAAASTFDGTQDWHTVMACHTLPEGVDGACVGYLLSDHAADNFAVRLAFTFEPDLYGQLEPDGDLHQTYTDMRAALVEHWGRV